MVNYYHYSKLKKKQTLEFNNFKHGKDFKRKKNG